jgi:hypothetical protein
MRNLTIKTQKRSLTRTMDTIQTNSRVDEMTSAYRQQADGRETVLQGSHVVCFIALILLGIMSGVSQAAASKLTADDSETFDHFGHAVAIDHNTVLVGAYSKQGLIDDGAVYVFKHNGSTWEPASRLRPLDPGWPSRHFGYAVAVDANTAIVGAPWASGGGSAYIFQYDGIEWYQQARLVANDANGDFVLFGCSVAVNGDTVIVGAKNDNQGSENSGAAYIFKRDGSIWTQQTKLKASDADADPWFGHAVAIDANTAVVGAHSVGWNTPSGWAYIFQWNGSTWTEKARLMENDSSDCVAICDRTVVSDWRGLEVIPHE